MPTRRTHSSLSLLCLIAAASVGVVGCATGGSNRGDSAVGSALRPASGTIHGGQQPIAGSQIALYAAGKSGIGSASRAMLSAPVLSDASGNFSLTGLYNCQPGDQVYLTATGGNSGSGANNAIAMLATLGPCASIQASTFVNVDEVSTVASIFSIAPFMSGAQNIGADPANSNALAAAFAATQTLADRASGLALPASAGNGIVPTATIDSLANSLASCINSPQGSAPCSSLFTDTAVQGAAPTDTLQATLNVALHPTSNTTAIFLLATPAAPFQPTLSAAPASYALSVQHPSDVLLYHNDIARTGVQPYEQTLTPANVNPTLFGKIYSFTVDSYLFAQPLYVGGLGMPDGAVHNLVIAASTHATVYAFDADNNNPASGFLWSQSYLPSGERFAQSADYGGCGNPPESGIVGTPVIDRASQTLYFVTKTVTITGSTFFHRLHAVSLLDGSERPGSPQIIQPTFAGTGDGSSGGVIPFNPQRQNNRSALLITTNASGAKTVWIAYASHCDVGPYHGLLLGYNAADVTKLTATFNDTPNGSDGGIWGSSGGPAADPQGNIYVLGGNGTFDANTGGPDFGDTAMKLVPPAAGASSNLMTVADYFTPSTQLSLEQHDNDLGGSEPLLFSDPASGVAPTLLVASDKAGYVYLINPANMGRYQTGTNGPDSLNGDIQDFGGNNVFIYNFSFFNNTLFTSSPLRAYAFVPGTATTAGKINPNPIASLTTNSFVAPVVSANGFANPIVWLLDLSDNLSAFNPDLTQLYSSNIAANNRDHPAGAIRFTSPVIANGKVFLSGSGAITVYGLLP